MLSFFDHFRCGQPPIESDAPKSLLVGRGLFGPSDPFSASPENLYDAVYDILDRLELGADSKGNVDLCTHATFIGNRLRKKVWDDNKSLLAKDNLYASIVLFRQTGDRRILPEIINKLKTYRCDPMTVNFSPKASESAKACESAKASRSEIFLEQA